MAKSPESAELRKATRRALHRQFAKKYTNVLVASKDAKVEAKDGVFVVTSTGGDPYVSTREVTKGVGPFTVEFRMKSDSKGGGQVFWATADEPAFHRDRSTAFTPALDGEWAEYAVKVPADKPLTALRIDPSTAAGEIRIESVRQKGKDGKVLQEWTARPPK